MPTEESKICASSARASSKTCLTLSSVRSSGGGDERAAAKAGSLVRLDDVRGCATTTILSPSLGLSTRFRMFEIGRELQQRTDDSITDTM
jgi:hypothetical protein